MLQHTKQGNLSFLVPLDGSQLAGSVLPVVEQIASHFHAQVTLLHIMEQHPCKFCKRLMTTLGAYGLLARIHIDTS